MGRRLRDARPSPFEREHPDDARPRHAITVARAWVLGGCSVMEARAAASSAHAAARKARGGPSVHAARAAGHAAATAHASGHARAAAWYALKVIAGVQPGFLAKERAWQRAKVPRRLRARTFPLPAPSGRRR